MKHLSRKKLKMITNAADKVKTVLQLWAEPSDFIDENENYTIDFQSLYNEILNTDFSKLKINLLEVLQEFIDEQQQK